MNCCNEGGPRATSEARGIKAGASCVSGDGVPVLDQALADWAAHGADAATLAAVPVQIAPLDGTLVGWTAADGITYEELACLSVFARGTESVA